MHAANGDYISADGLDLTEAYIPIWAKLASDLLGNTLHVDSSL